MQHHTCLALTAIVFISLFQTAASVHPLQLQLDIAFSPHANLASSKRLAKRNDSLAVGIQGFDNFTTIIANATIGTPPQLLQFYVSPSSADLIVVSSLDPSCATGSCNTGTFNPNKSSTYSKLNSTFDLNFADGTAASGSYSTDDLTIGGTTINALQFGLAQNSTVVANSLGIGYSSEESKTGSYANLPLRLYVDGITNVIGYSIWFDGPNTNTGKLALGAVDTGRFNGTLETLPIQLDKSSLSYSYATIDMTSMSASVNGTNVNFDNSSMNVIIDADTSILALSQNVYNQVLQLLGAEFDATLELPVRSKFSPNSDRVTFGFNFGATTLQVPLDDLMVSVNDTHIGFLLSTVDSWNILGVPFVRNAYVVFDYSHNQISLAQPYHSSETNITLIGQNGVTGLVSTVSNPASPDVPSPSSSSGNSTSSAGISSPTVQPKSDFSTTTKIGIGIGVAAGVATAAAFGAALFIRNRRHRTAAARVADSKVVLVGTEPVDRYRKAELPAAGVGRTAKEKAELSDQNQRHELNGSGERADPVELLASVPEPQELATSTERSVSEESTGRSESHRNILGSGRSRHDR